MSFLLLNGMSGISINPILSLWVPSEREKNDVSKNNPVNTFEDINRGVTMINAK